MDGWTVGVPSTLPVSARQVPCPGKPLGLGKPDRVVDALKAQLILFLPHSASFVFALCSNTLLTSLVFWGQAEGPLGLESRS